MHVIYFAAFFGFAGLALALADIFHPRLLVACLMVAAVHAAIAALAVIVYAAALLVGLA